MGLRPAPTALNLGDLQQQLGNRAEAVFREALAVAERMIAAHPDQPLGHDLKAFLQQPR